MSDEEVRVRVGDGPMLTTREREYYKSFTINGKSKFQVHDIVFLDQLGRDKTKDLNPEERLRLWWIGVVENIFIERSDSKREVYCGIRWFYREADFAPALGSLPAGFAAESDELIFSDHYDENPATAIEDVANVKLCVELSAVSPKLARDGRHFACRWIWLTKEERLLDLATALVLDGDKPVRSCSILRMLVKRTLTVTLPESYEDPAGPINYTPLKGISAVKAATAPSSASRSKKLVKRARSSDGKNGDGNGDDDDNDGDDDSDDGDDSDNDGAKKKAAKAEKERKPSSAKKANVKRHPTLSEASQLLLTRGELAVLSHTKSYRDVIGGLLLLKHKDDKGQPQTTLFEIDSVPEVDAPYRPYSISYIGADGQAQQVDDCVAGVELLIDDGSTSRRSLVNMRDRALEKGDYDAWVVKSNAKSRYPALASEIKATVARIEALRKTHTRSKVKADA